MCNSPFIRLSTWGNHAYTVLWKGHITANENQYPLVTTDLTDRPSSVLQKALGLLNHPCKEWYYLSVSFKEVSGSHIVLKVKFFASLKFTIRCGRIIMTTQYWDCLVWSQCMNIAHPITISHFISSGTPVQPILCYIYWGVSIHCFLMSLLPTNGGPSELILSVYLYSVYINQPPILSQSQLLLLNMPLVYTMTLINYLL